MLASGHVSEASLQYQLKHAKRSMTRYYGQNYYRLSARLDDEARGYFLREMYQAVVRDFEALQSDRFVSPYGEKRKSQILIRISEKDHEGLLKDAMAGRISYRETFLGGCTKTGDPCELGGISNVSGCMGHGCAKPCEYALLDRGKQHVVKQLQQVFLDRLAKAEPGSFLAKSLQAQLESAERALHVLSAI